MSLQLAAQHIQQHGRNGDSMLVHMSPKEVKSLNDLAMAHGGQLSINPHTGLPEAGFLSSILPMVAGFALGPAGFGLSQMEASLASGALSMALNPGGGLMGGLMAGVGAYGGAGLGQALAQQGMQAEAQAAQQAAEAAKLPQSIITQAPMAQAATGANPTLLSSLGMPPDATQSVLANVKPVSEAITASYPSSALNLGAPITASNTLVSDLTPMQNANYALQGVKTLGTKEGWSQLADNAGGVGQLAKYGFSAAAPVIADASRKTVPTQEEDKDMGQRYTFAYNPTNPTPTADIYGREQRYFKPQYTPVSNQTAKNIFGFASGGLAEPGTPTQYSYDPTAQTYDRIDTPASTQPRSANQANYPNGGGRGPEGRTDAQQAQAEANAQALGMDTSNPMKMVAQALMGLTPLGPVISLAKMMGLTGENGGVSSGIGPSSSAGESASSSTGSGNQASKAGAIAAGTGNVGLGPGPGAGNAAGTPGVGASGYATGGISDAQYNLGGYSDGGRLLRGPGDGVSDSIPATIGHKQPARLADGEFVVPARIVSELGNGSTDAGARKLYAMMDRIQKARGSTVGKGKVAKNSRAEQYLPA